MSFEGASAIVTGGASGIGSCSARELSRLGAHVVVADLQDDLGSQVAREIGGEFVHCDITSEEDVAIVVMTAGRFGPLRALVGSAGSAGPARILDHNNDPISQATVERLVEVNLLGAFNVLRQSVAAMAKTPPIDEYGARGTVVNIASIAAFDGPVGQAPYAAAKGGVVAMTLPAARDLASVGIRVNTVAPGPVDTPMYGTGERAEEMKNHLTESTLYPKRLGTPEEIAFVVVECLTNPYMNGAVIRVDGGTRLPPK